MKAQIKLLIIIFLLFGTMNSCTKFGKNVTIEGRVENPITGEGISGAEIWLLKTTMGLPGADKEIKTVFSDANGNFELNKFSFRADKIRIGNAHGDYHSIGWYKDGEYVSGNSTLEIKKGKKLNVDFHLVPYGGIQLNINNVNCLNSDDYFVLYAEGIQVDNSINGFMIDGIGCYHYNPDNYTKVPMGKRYYRYEVTRNNITNIFYDTIFIGAGENKIYEINY